MASAMLGLSKILGIPKPFCAKALLSGAMAVRRHTAAVEKQGKALLATLKPEDKILVLITRNYGVSDPILNMGIPELLLERGYKVITLSHLPGHALDISDEYDNLYYPFGQHILSGAKLIAHHPNLYAVYLTNHGCGPDTMLSHLFKQEMGDNHLRNLHRCVSIRLCLPCCRGTSRTSYSRIRPLSKPRLLQSSCHHLPSGYGQGRMASSFRA